MILVCNRQRDERTNTFLVEVGQSWGNDTRFAAFRIQEEIGSNEEGANRLLGAIAGSDHPDLASGRRWTLSQSSC